MLKGLYKPFSKIQKEYFLSSDKAIEVKKRKLAEHESRVQHLRRLMRRGPSH